MESESAQSPAVVTPFHLVIAMPPLLLLVIPAALTVFGLPFAAVAGLVRLVPDSPATPLLVVAGLLAGLVLGASLSWRVLRRGVRITLLAVAGVPRSRWSTTTLV